MVKYMSIIISTYDVIDTSFFVYTQGSGTLKVWVGTLKVWVDSQGKNALKVRWDSQGKGTLMVHTPVSQSLSPNPFSFQDLFFFTRRTGFLQITAIFEAKLSSLGSRNPNPTAAPSCKPHMKSVNCFNQNDHLTEYW